MGDYRRVRDHLPQLTPRLEKFAPVHRQLMAKKSVQQILAFADG